MTEHGMRVTIEAPEEVSNQMVKLLEMLFKDGVVYIDKPVVISGSEIVSYHILTDAAAVIRQKSS